MTSHAQLSHRRAQFPYASDWDVLQLSKWTSDWLTTHGAVVMRGEVFGLPAAKDEDNRITPLSGLMLGTAAVEYWARISHATLTEYAPDAIDGLGVTDAGLEIGYGEPYLRVPSGGSSRGGFIPGHVRFLPLEPDGTANGAVTYDIIRRGGSRVDSLYTDPTHEVPHGAGGETELKTNEYEALSWVYLGLLRLDRENPGRQDFLW